MPNKSYLVHGQWNAICDVCGFKFKASELTKNWKNEMACTDCWEPRHPQDYIRVRKDNPSVPWTRPEGEDEFIGPACFLWQQSAYADLGTADCMQADYTPLSYVELFYMKNGVYP